jgi:hypothetical protein
MRVLTQLQGGGRAGAPECPNGEFRRPPGWVKPETLAPAANCAVPRFVLAQPRGIAGTVSLNPGCLLTLSFSCCIPAVYVIYNPELRLLAKMHSTSAIGLNKLSGPSFIHRPPDSVPVVSGEAPARLSLAALCANHALTSVG